MFIPNEIKSISFNELFDKSISDRFIILEELKKVVKVSIEIIDDFKFNFDTFPKFIPSINLFPIFDKFSRLIKDLKSTIKILI